MERRDEDFVDETIVQDKWEPEPETQVVREEVVEPPPRRPLPTLWPWLLALLVLVLGGVGAAYYFSRDDGGSGAATTAAAEQVSVPVLIGLREARARERVRGAGLEAGIRREPGNRPRGVVVAQRPRAGESLAKGDAVLITVSTGPPKETVPDVVGEQSGEAVADLRQAGFESKLVQAFSAKPAGTVMKQVPASGKKVKQGALVTLTASRGQKPKPVPDVVGGQASDAAATLRQAGFRVTLVTVPSDQANGTVVAQAPPAGKVAPRGAVVRLNVAQQQGTTTGAATTPAQSATVTVPDVVASTQRAAVEAFRKAGLKASVRFVPSQEPQGQVVAQAKPPGTALKRGSAVQINVSTGLKPQAATSVPDVVGLAQAEARAQLEGAGFTVQVLPQETNDPAQEGTVLDQQPAAGGQAPRGSEIVLYIGSAPA